MTKKRTLATRCDEELHQKVSHLAWLTQRSVNDITLSILTPAIDIIYENLEAQASRLTATEHVAAADYIDIEALKKHTKFMDNLRRTGKPAVAFPHIPRTSPPEVPERTNRGNQKTRNKVHATQAAEKALLEAGIERGTVDPKTHEVIDPATHAQLAEALAGGAA